MEILTNILINILLSLSCILILILCIFLGGFTIRFYNGWIQETIAKKMLEQNQTKDGLVK